VLLLENLRFHPEEEGVGVREDKSKFTPSEEQVRNSVLSFIFCIFHFSKVRAFRAGLTALGDV
jgi:hypothetical protein